MITFRNVVGFLETIGEKHHMINSFHSGGLSEVDINKLGASDYTILYAEPGEATINTGVMTYSFTIYVMDLINDQIEGDAPNRERTVRTDAYSETLLIMQDVINEFKHAMYSTSWVDNEVVLETPITVEPFTARFENELTGWAADITIEVNNTNNLCNVPSFNNS